MLQLEAGNEVTTGLYRFKRHGFMIGCTEYHTQCHIMYINPAYYFSD